MPLYNKKPVTIAAIQYTGADNKGAIDQFLGKILEFEKDGLGLIIPTLEGLTIASVGDFVIRGVKGEYYACKPDIFEMTYEAVPLEITFQDVHGGKNDTSPKCTLTDVELLEACHKAISEQSRDGKWQMCVPPDMNADYDMILCELANRYEKACKEPALGNATTDQMITELYARFDSFPNLRAIPFTAIVEHLRDRLTQEELQYRTNDQPLTMRSLPNENSEAKPAIYHFTEIEKRMYEYQNRTGYHSDFDFINEHLAELKKLIR